MTLHSLSDVFVILKSSLLCKVVPIQVFTSMEYIWQLGILVHKRGKKWLDLYNIILTAKEIKVLFYMGDIAYCNVCEIC